MPDRRSFLAALAASLAARAGGAAALDAVSAGCAPSAPRDDGAALAPLGVQLYTLRNQMRADVAGTLARVARIGYREVEFAGYFGRPAAALRALLDANGLRAPSAHLPVPPLGAGWDRALADAATLGHEYVVVASMNAERRRTLDDLRRVAGELDAAGEAARRAGLRLAYHNHDFEFAPVEGRMLYEVLLEETDPALVELELDLYWATKGGQDPLAWFARYPGRFPLLHVKDSSGPPEHRMTPVGEGTIDFRRVLAASARSGARHLFVEHDDPADAWASVEASYRWLSRLAV